MRIQRLDKRQYPKKLLFIYDKPNHLKKYECPRVFLDNGAKDPKFVENPWGNGLRPTNVRYDPAVYAVTPRDAEDVTCIAMTRSMGDFYAHQYGLTHVPDVSVRGLKPDCDYTVAIGSDGVWDCWTWADFSDDLHVGNSPQKDAADDNHADADAAHPQSRSSRSKPQQKSENNSGPRHTPIGEVTVQLLDKSVSEAIKHFGKGSYDDATLVLMRIGPHGPRVAPMPTPTMPSSVMTDAADYGYTHVGGPSPTFVTDAAPVYRSGFGGDAPRRSNGRGH